MVQPETFGAWVRHRRRELDLTQEELAHRVGCARITIRKIESEQLRPSKQMAGLLLEHLGIAPTDREDLLRFARNGVSTAPSAAHAPRHNLPLQLTSFIGRETEILQARQLLKRHRLVTLIGSGGTGKSRLSLEVAAQALEDFVDGTWLVELAPLSDTVLVPNAVASVLGIRQEPDRPLMHTILDWLRTRQVLIILDNCEHLLDACARLADAILQGGREARILATSRQPFGVAGEACYRVPSLRCAELDQAAGLRVDQLQEYPAARLFTERAIEAAGTFTVLDEDVPAIVEICQRLDGIPLAIELAAARVTALRVGQISERLDDRFRLLTGGSRTALPRHQTLGSLIDWSHNLLSEPERRLLRRLSVFAGGWTLEAAEAVCAGEALESAEVLHLLIQLVDKSLVALDERTAQPRYRMLETIREYAHTRLLEAGEGELLGQRHLRFFLQLAEQTRPALQTGARPEALLRLEAEHDNLRGALEWACVHDMEIGRWLGGILERFWFFGDHLGEAHTWYGRLLDDSEQLAASRGLGLAVLGAGCVAFNLELMDEAQRSLERSVELWRQLADEQWLTYAMGWLAYLLLQRGESAMAEDIYARNEASFRAHSDDLNMVWILSCWGTAKCLLHPDDPSGKALLDDALALARLHEDPFGFMMCYSCLGDWAVLHNDYAAARDHFEAALRWRRKLGTRWILAAGLWQVASILRLQGDYSGAGPMYQEAIQLARDLGDQRSQAHISQELGVVATHLGRMAQASILLESSLTVFHRWADPLGITRCLLAFVDLRHAQGRMETAARLLGFLEAWLRANMIQLLHFDRANYERSLAAARRQLSESTFAASEEAGSHLSLNQAIDLALQQTES